MAKITNSTFLFTDLLSSKSLSRCDVPRTHKVQCIRRLIKWNQLAVNFVLYISFPSQSGMEVCVCVTLWNMSVTCESMGEIIIIFKHEIHNCLSLIPNQRPIRRTNRNTRNTIFIKHNTTQSRFHIQRFIERFVLVAHLCSR